MKFSVIGTGNVAWHFTKMFMGVGHNAIQVWARKADRARAFATEFSVEQIDELEELSSENDFVLLAVSDDAIAELSNKIPGGLFVIHSSGGTSLDALTQTRKAVAWGIQSFTRGVELQYSGIPFLIEASGGSERALLESLFRPISPLVYYTTGEQRAKAHLAATFACNFSNHLYGRAQEILKEINLPFEILLPSIDLTAQRIHHMDAKAAQTGPASRADLKTLNRHLELLRSKPELKQIYELLTNSILQLHHGKKL